MRWAESDSALDRPDKSITRKEGLAAASVNYEIITVQLKLFGCHCDEQMHIVPILPNLSEQNASKYCTLFVTSGH
jgi:hypothetical protein